ncbi:unnamed protein product [Vitrella brassicaformis CCMP3155]|uniref:Uncharacterized protein n=1 Tax=Vitrella brassicaformis (strain CCMP3155) TaxID=1169540 RepID=A0A0G4G5D2_VITBC|nr:unnamed protein product [Vitrella brassicaformis CCMP3155]|eukprot:CEM23445.1 unnamed protein product [Vitrella brassicaformis CCMP3155]
MLFVHHPPQRPNTSTPIHTVLDRMAFSQSQPPTPTPASIASLRQHAGRRLRPVTARSEQPYDSEYEAHLETFTKATESIVEEAHAGIRKAERVLSAKSMRSDRDRESLAESAPAHSAPPTPFRDVIGKIETPEFPYEEIEERIKSTVEQQGGMGQSRAMREAINYLREEYQTQLRRARDAMVREFRQWAVMAKRDREMLRASMEKSLEDAWEQRQKSISKETSDTAIENARLKAQNDRLRTLLLSQEMLLTIARHQQGDRDTPRRETQAKETSQYRKRIRGLELANSRLQQDVHARDEMVLNLREEIRKLQSQLEETEEERHSQEEMYEKRILQLEEELQRRELELTQKLDSYVANFDEYKKDTSGQIKFLKAIIQRQTDALKLYEAERAELIKAIQKPSTRVGEPEEEVEFEPYEFISKLEYRKDLLGMDFAWKDYPPSTPSLQGTTPRFFVVRRKPTTQTETQMDTTTSPRSPRSPRTTTGTGAAGAAKPSPRPPKTEWIHIDTSPISVQQATKRLDESLQQVKGPRWRERDPRFSASVRERGGRMELDEDGGGAGGAGQNRGSWTDRSYYKSGHPPRLPDGPVLSSLRPLVIPPPVQTRKEWLMRHQPPEAVIPLPALTIG